HRPLAQGEAIKDLLRAKAGLRRVGHRRLFRRVEHPGANELVLLRPVHLFHELATLLDKRMVHRQLDNLSGNELGAQPLHAWIVSHAGRRHDADAARSPRLVKALDAKEDGFFRLGVTRHQLTISQSSAKMSDCDASHPITIILSAVFIMIDGHTVAEPPWLRANACPWGDQ